MLKLLLLYGVACGGIGLAFWAVYSPTLAAARKVLEKKVATASEQLSELYLWVPSKRLWLSYGLSPLVCGFVGWQLLHHWLGGAIGVVAGILVPEMLIRYMQAARRKKFGDQLVESLMVLSSSLRAGLSLLQAVEVLVEEMPAPTSQEFAMVLKEHRMGVTLQDALLHLKERMPSDDISMMVTTILVSRETGGDITQLFMRLVETIRARKQLKEKIATLTMQARLQGFVLVALPIGFAFLAYSTNPTYFRIFFTDIVGRALLCAAVAAQIMGAILIWRFSRPPIY